jgi:hypothetical protein
MIKIYPTTLNSHGETIHPIAKFALDTLVYFMPDTFCESGLADCDCVLTNAPACPPYSFHVELASEIMRHKKPVFILSDADGYMPDCEGNSPNKEQNFQNFVRDYADIKAYFYREWHAGYERPDLPFPLLPFELVGYLWTRHPKDRADYTAGINKQNFMGRKWDVMFTSSLNCQSRIAMFDALKDFGNCLRVDLNKEGKKPAEIWMNELLTAKIVICLEGAGIKCVSHCEAPHAALMAMHDIPMVESYPWVHQENCIRLVYERDKGEGHFIHHRGRGLIDAERSVFRLKQALSNPDMLWEIAERGFENARRYSLANYYRNHIGANIQKYL